MKRLMPYSGDPEPKKTYRTQAEVDAANAAVRAQGKRQHLINAEDLYVAKKAGDPIVPVMDMTTGKPYDGRYSKMPQSMIKPLPDWVTELQWDDQWQQPYYLDGNDMVFVDKAHFNSPKFLKPMAMANGLMAVK